jgi:signal transduction histidine kinase
VNARDAMPNGGRVTISVDTVELDETASSIALVEGHPGRYARISVTDTGIGMDARTQARLFEPFFTTKEPGKGTGLGLSIVYGIARQSGGYITVTSEPGRGARFIVWLPVAAAPALVAVPAPA